VPAEFRQRVIAVIASLRPGEVVSYGDVAAEAGYPGAARGVGSVLANTGPEDGLPWWRVIMSSGRLAPGKERDQGRRLRAEGIEVVGDRVRLAQRTHR
jgi:methylated-DNA-protein-cysteine methyltransferase-like protein